MQSIIIAAGYATRLYPLTENFPKPLLQVGKTTILDRLIDDLDTIDDISGHHVVTNHKFIAHFEQWAARRAGRGKPITLIDDGTTSNDNRLGAVCDLLLALERGGIDDDILVAAADNLLEFSLRGFVDCFHEKGTSLLMCHHEPSLDKLRRTGVITVDADMRVLAMQEKPQVPASHWAVPPFYLYSHADLPLVRTCLEHGCGRDAPGNLAHFLVERTPLHAWPMPAGRFDIGSLDTYRQAQQLFG